VVLAEYGRPRSFSGYRVCHLTRVETRLRTGFLRAIQIRSTTSFGGEVKPAISCRLILRNVKVPYSMKEVMEGKIYGHLLPSLSCFATRRLYWLLPDSYSE
jgi:hypothetical protein